MGSRLSQSLPALALCVFTYKIPGRYSKILLFVVLHAYATKWSGWESLMGITETWAGYLGLFLARQASYLRKVNRPKRIILIRHGESEGNVDKSLYSRIPDNKMRLSKEGKNQAVRAAKQLQKIVHNESVIYYVSPYTRTRQTQQILSEWVGGHQAPCIEEARLREQDFGNFQDPDQMKISMRDRADFGRFYYRFMNGESGADVYDRMSSFFSTLFRHTDSVQREKFDNYIIVSHGLTMRLFLMRYLKWSVEQFEQVHNPDNCEIWVMEKHSNNGRYELKSDIRYGNYEECGGGVPKDMRCVGDVSRRQSRDLTHIASTMKFRKVRP
uniref:Phosphoglycerate mutase (2,3-diphosphoglycerate-dependent) n=1 Tax=Lotharella globosa TaxID=91324 RepID=A0A7S3Z2Q6_9EUKA